MRMKWLVALAVICTLIWVSGSVAGPSRPQGGDPDIWERSRSANPNYSVGCLNLHTQVVSLIDLVVYQVRLKQQDAKQSSKADASTTSISKRDRSWR